MASNNIPLAYSILLIIQFVKGIFILYLSTFPHLTTRPLHEEAMNERADRTDSSALIHEKQSVQTLRVLGRRNAC
ncbi:hypothetical protein DTO166G4_7534 [Paecilomyces variotii]|nr:hypothetical protein DTO166G4_7534 [Paecilomyces variotii]KAJ9234401.1 hypothetical protein DTO166G5_5207 [Paecilomyces variotii]